MLSAGDAAGPHEVMPRLWVGAYGALRQGGKVLRDHRVTHVLSVTSAELDEPLPKSVIGHLHIKVHDSEESAEAYARHFDGIVRFIEAAREGEQRARWLCCGAAKACAPAHS